MLTQHIALVPEADGVSLSELARVSAALQKQVIRDVAPLWGMAATVDAFPRLEDVPVGYHPIIISLCELGSEAGVYLDGNGHPYAQIELWASWSLDASRACIEMLVNPFGNRSVTGPSPRSDQGPVEFLVEACAPCAGPLYAYAVNDVIVSDFCTPAFFGAGSSMQAERYSFTGATEEPFEVLPGGHLSWYDPASDSWWRRSQFGEAPIDTRLDQSGMQVASVRQLARGEGSTNGDRLSLESFEARLGVTRRHALLASQVQAQRLRALLGQGLEAEIVSYGSVPPSRGARGGPLGARDERQLRSASAKSTRPPEASPKRGAIDVVGLDAEVEPSAANAQSTTSKPPPLPVSQAPASATPSQPAVPVAAPPSQPVPIPVPQYSGYPQNSSYPQMPAVVFTTPPQPPQTGARDTAFLLGGVLAAAALLALVWGGRALLTNSASTVPTSQPAAVVTHADAVPPPPSEAPSPTRYDAITVQARPPAIETQAHLPGAGTSVVEGRAAQDHGDPSSSKGHSRHDAERQSRSESDRSPRADVSPAPVTTPTALEELLDTRR